jgi:hypothetical protein
MAKLGEAVEVRTTVGDVVVTVRVEPATAEPTAAVSDGAVEAGRAPASKLQLGGGRNLPRLLFVTDPVRLEKQIGVGEAALAISMIKEAGHQIVEVSGADAATAAMAVRNAIDGSTKGVVIVGGYEVVAAFKVDTLPNEVAHQVPRSLDLDAFLVWSDDPYVDTDADGLPELPVSRMPGRTALVLFRQMTVGAAPRGGRGGIRNAKRDFADQLVGGAAGDSKLVVSHPADSTAFERSWIDHTTTYLMLHGLDVDGTRFLGEDSVGRTIEAFPIADVPHDLEGTYFSACCWGALINSATARAAQKGKPVADRSELQSIAIAVLAAGANAFVGCTGSHYSPKANDPTRFGAAFHKAFFEVWPNAAGAAEATFLAKVEYLRYLARIDQAKELAYATKTINEFTCLGLGW